MKPAAHCTFCFYWPFRVFAPSCCFPRRVTMTPGLAAWTASGRAHPDDGTKDEREISRWRQLGQRKHLLQELWF